jgi:butyryl-CoA dehydrogenase
MPPVRLIEHADVKRMLLAQKAYVEGGLALILYCGRLVDLCRTATGDEYTVRHALLELLTPIAKSWPSEWCLEGNNHAIQIHGGYGYTRDFAVEQYWRDNRLNMIHEGAHGIHGLDLLGRKVVLEQGRALHLFAHEVQSTIEAARAHTELDADARALNEALDALLEATRRAWSTGMPEEALANATPYLQGFGHIVLAWLWLDLACVALERSTGKKSNGHDRDFLLGKQQAARYFFDYELPRVAAWLEVAAARTRTCLDMQDEWFES